MFMVNAYGFEVLSFNRDEVVVIEERASNV